MDRLMTVYKYRAPLQSGHAATYVAQQEHWMARQSLRADERFSADAKQRYADVAQRFTSYPIDGLEITDLLKDESGQFWDIRAIVEIGYGEAVEIDVTLKATAPEIITPPNPDAEKIAFSITIGEDSDWRGFIQSSIGTISAQPIDGASVGSVVASKSDAGSGGVEINGPLATLEPLLTGADVWIDGVKITNPYGWMFSSGQALWWVTSGFPAFVVEGEALIELKPANP